MERRKPTLRSGPHKAAQFRLDRVELPLEREPGLPRLIAPSILADCLELPRKLHRPRPVEYPQGAAKGVRDTLDDRQIGRLERPP